MEDNIADGLKLGFALLAFVMAMTLLFMSVTNARTAADSVYYYADDSNFQGHMESAQRNRLVPVSEVITTLYRYYNENVAVCVRFRNNTSYLFDLGKESYKSDEVSSLTDIDSIEKNLGEFINTILIQNHGGSQFEEAFIEVPTSGKYVVEEDGTEFTITSGSKKIYITYIEQ